MYKKLLLLFFLYTQTLSPWFGQVVLITKDDAGDDRVLLAYNGNKNIFHAFAQEAGQGERGNEVAQKAFDALQNSPILKGSDKSSVLKKYKIAGTPWGAVEYFDKDYKKNVSDIFHVVEISFDDSTNFTRDSSKGAGWIKLTDILNMQDNADISKIKFPEEIKKKKPKISQRLFDFFKGNNKPAGDKLKNAKTFDEIVGMMEPLIIEKVTTTSSIIDCPDITFKDYIKEPWPRGRDAILFYNKGVYYPFTNTYYVAVNIDGTDWTSTEHYFQAGKFGNKLTDQIRKDLAKEGAGSLQKKAENGDAPFDQIDKDWFKKEWQGGGKNKERMLNVLWAKFTQHDDLKKLLLSTKGKILVEDAGEKDKMWGNGANGTGCNHLGQMLMHLRDAFLSLENQGQKVPDQIPSWFKYTPHTPSYYADAYKKGELVVKAIEIETKSSIEPMVKPTLKTSSLAVETPIKSSYAVNQLAAGLKDIVSTASQQGSCIIF